MCLRTRPPLFFLIALASIEARGQVPENINPVRDPKPLTSADESELMLYIAAAAVIFILAMVWYWKRRKQNVNGVK